MNSNQSSPSQLIEKLIKVDRFLINQRKGSIAQSSEKIQAFKKLELWYTMNKPNDRQAANYIKSNWERIEKLIPGGKQHDTYVKQFNQIIHNA